MSDRGPAFDAAVVAYEAARAARDRIIDHPDRTISVDEYRARIADAQHKCHMAHRDMMEAWG